MIANHVDITMSMYKITDMNCSEALSLHMSFQCKIALFQSIVKNGR